MLFNRLGVNILTHCYAVPVSECLVRFTVKNIRKKKKKNVGAHKVITYFYKNVITQVPMSVCSKSYFPTPIFIAYSFLPTCNQVRDSSLKIK